MDEFCLRESSLHEFYLGVQSLIDVFDGVEFELTVQGSKKYPA
jgi:hypothetical protein